MGVLQKKAEIAKEALETWNLGLKLRLISKEDDRRVVKQIEGLIENEASRDRNGIKKEKGKKRGKI